MHETNGSYHSAVASGKGNAKKQLVKKKKRPMNTFI